MNAKPKSTASLVRRRAATPLVALALGVAGWAQPVEAAPCNCDITVGSGSTTTITSDTSADCIDVAGTLEINAGVTLTLTGPGPSCVDGTVMLIGSVSVLRFTTNDHTVTGSGKIKGFNSSAEIAIDSVTLTSDVKITGRLKITGSGDFTNEGSVTADSTNGSLDVQVTGTIADEAGATWTVKENGAMLRFLQEPSCLQGDFTVTAGTLLAGGDPEGGDDIDVVTSGSLTHTGGKIIAGVDDSFVFNGTCP